MSADRGKLMDAALAAVSAAAVVTRAVQRQAQRGKIDKLDGSPVTIADFAAQAVVSRELARRFGAIRVVAEESSAYLRNPVHEKERRAALAAAQLTWPDANEDDLLGTIDLGAYVPPEGVPTPSPLSFWTLDPIDGTKGFIRGHQYCVCLAYVENGAPVVAALACPNLSEDLERPFTDPDPHGITILADDSGRVVSVPTDEPGAPPRSVERRARAAGSPLVFCESWEASHSDQSATKRVMTALADKGLPMGPAARIDSQCKYAVVGRGQVDVFLRRPRNLERRDWIWDHAPGWLIARNLGATVTDAHGGAMDFSLGRTLAANHGVLAARPDVHPLLLEELKKLDAVAR